MSYSQVAGMDHKRAVYEGERFFFCIPAPGYNTTKEIPRGSTFMARYLVTGGCGFIGSHVADALVSAGHWVRVLDNLSTGKRANAPASAELVVGDICDFAVVKRCVERRIDDPRRGWHLPCGLEQMDGAAKIDRMAFEPFPQ